MALTDSQKEVCSEVEEFKRQIDEEEIEVRPDTSSPRQNTISNILGSDLDYYQRKREELQRELSNLREEKKSAIRVAREADSYSVEELLELRSPATDALRVKLYECAQAIREQITAARVHGMIHPTEGLRKKYKQCMEDNAILSKQILDYKDRLGLKQ